MKTTLQSSRLTKEFLTNLPLASVILSYYGYADECRGLMTQLRSGSRSLWNLNRHILLRNYPGEEDEVRLILKKKSLQILVALHWKFRINKEHVLDTRRFMMSEFSKLYQLELKVFEFQLVDQMLLDIIFKGTDMKTVTIKSVSFVCNYYILCNDDFRRYDPTLIFNNMKKLAKVLHNEFEVYELEDCKYFIPPKIFEVRENCLAFKTCGSEGITFWKSYPVCGNEDNEMLEEQRSFCKIITQIMKNLKTTSVEQVFQNILSSVLEIEVSYNGILNKSIALIELSKKLKIWSKYLQARNCRLKTVRLFLSFCRYYGPREESDSLFEPLVPFAQSCIQSGLSLQLKEKYYSNSEPQIQTNLAYWVLEDKALVIKKFEGSFENYFTHKCWAYKECLVLHKNSVRINIDIIDVILLDDVGVNKQILKNNKIIIPMKNILSFHKDISQLTLKNIPLLPVKSLTVSISLDKATKRILNRIKILHKDTKIKLEASRYYEVSRDQDGENLTKFFDTYDSKNLVSLKIHGDLDATNELNQFVEFIQSKKNLKSLEFSISRNWGTQSYSNTIKNLFSTLRSLPNLKFVSISASDPSTSISNYFHEMSKRFISQRLETKIEITIGSKEYLDRCSRLTKKFSHLPS
ncbi:unnamed protein product [Moneuplotes crassus]|uniref:Uncharacterized protein n=1 Tax=Euplotes crassus TaxID=5936 RepID=A0AAD1Y8J1_EUPCR|nr:unnamed protein product [Moneuplotes crassus]